MNLQLRGILKPTQTIALSPPRDVSCQLQMTVEPSDLSSSVFSIYGRPGVLHHYTQGEGVSKPNRGKHVRDFPILAYDSMHAKAASN